MTDHETWWIWGRRVVASLLIGFVITATVYNALRIRAVYRNSQDIVALQAQLADMRAIHDARIADALARLDEIERVLFGNVVTKLEQVPLAKRVEQWQQNRDKELRDRINRLERWRAQVEN